MSLWSRLNRLLKGRALAGAAERHAAAADRLDAALRELLER
jgi:hypothetical protein